MLQLKNLTLRRGTRLLLEDVNLTVNPGQRVGLIGENGAGKSSLLALILKNLSPDAGEINLPGNLSIAHLEQEIPALAQAALEYVIDGDAELRRIEKALETETDGNKIAELYCDMSVIDGYTAKARAAQVMHGLGFVPAEQQKLVKDFSGGWRMRLNLARTLMSRADLLLLDEPTNHLDLDAIVWLEDWLKTTPSTVFLISHDRDFLDNVATHIAHLYRRQLKSYTGNYSDFEVQRAEEMAQQQLHHAKQERQRAHWQKFVDRFKVIASKAPQVQSRLKALAKMGAAEALHVDTPFRFSFKEVPSCSNPLLYIRDANIGYNNHPIIKHVSLSLTNDQRIGLIGPNGAGKSTLMQCLGGLFPPLAGEYFANPALKMGYFAQHQLDSLDLQASPYLHIQRLSPQATEKEIRNYLGGFAFVGDQAMSKIEHFSGGEKTRLALAILIWQKPNLLLLDEPTNHLDLEMRHALVVALQNYTGALVVVSHDRHLLRACTDSFLLVANNKVEEYEGDLEAYEKLLKDYRRNVEVPTIVAPESTESKPDNKEQRTKNNRLKKVEELLMKYNAEKQAIESQLAAPGLYDAENKAKLDKLLAEEQKLVYKLEELEKEWLTLHE